MKRKTKITTIAITVIGVISLSVVSLIWWNSPALRHKRYVRNYLNARTDIAEEVREAILNGKVIIGMYPDEAHAAAGRFMYKVEGDPKWGDNYFPPQVINSQRKNPDNSKIELTFWTKTQFDTKPHVSFTVFFERGKAARIERNN